VILCAATQSKAGSRHSLRGSASLESAEAKLWADQIDYDQETGEAVAQGHVHLKVFERGEELWCDRAEYNVETRTGRFYNVRGESPPRIDARPGLLMTSSPFRFQARWAEKIRERYILYDGLLTNCRLPRAWWTLRAPRFDIIPQQRALAYRSVFRLGFVPLLYAPVFYKSLEEQPRKSGFLTPNIGNSSRRGRMVGVGYYWAISRSYDASYRAQWFTQRGIAHTADFRGKPTQRSDFNAYLYGVNDQGQKLSDGERRKEGGFILSVDGQADLGRGYFARAGVNYLSSMRFRRAFTESFTEAIASEVHSAGFVEKHTGNYGLTVTLERMENVQDVGAWDPVARAYLPDNKIVIRRLPEAQAIVRPRKVRKRWKLPLWYTLESTAALMQRNQPLFQTEQFMPRIDFQPRLMSAAEWKGFRVYPSFAIRETLFGSHQELGVLRSASLHRTATEFTLELLPPSLSRTYDGPRWIGQKVKHVIEPRVLFRHAGGIEDFDKLILFDETELMTNTTEVEISLANRVFAKRGENAEEVLSWQLWQRRYFDPDFGGAVSALDPATGLPKRNVILSSLQLTGLTFLDGPRRYSPVVSVLRVSPLLGIGMEWRSDYDPLRKRPVNSILSADWRRGIYGVSVAHNYVRSGKQLSATANQLRGMFALGNDNRRGWNGAFSAVYDYRVGVMLYATTQVTYNTDCCGFSVQYRRFGLLGRSENQFRIAFSVANIGSFGTLKRQERLF
jgi:LPS-assembly protein